VQDTVPSNQLTQQVKAGGCASKLSPKLLDRVLAAVPRWPDANVLVGYDTADDAGVYRIAPDLAIVQTVDFFTPMVDDPFTFGAIAAANALSDVYAMGGRPISSLTIVAYPPKGDPAVLEAILKGGAEKMREAGCSILGGHSVADDEMKFGYAVTGLIHPEHILTNAGAQPGDAIVFTKRIGTGVISTALKRGLAAEEHVAAAILQMTTLNRRACEAMLTLDVHGCTDVTGFGLIGHARELALASKVTLEIEFDAIRFLPGALDYVRMGALPGGMHNNRDFAECVVEKTRSFDAGREALLYDPQTSGGLLVTLPPGDAAELERTLEGAYSIGRVVERAAKPIRLV